MDIVFPDSIHDFVVETKIKESKNNKIYDSLEHKHRKRNNRAKLRNSEEEKQKTIEYIELPGRDTLASISDPECKHWKRTRGNCIYGKECRFRHVTISVPKQQNIPKPAVFDPISGKRKRQRPRNKGRAGEFRRWLISKFGVELLSQGTGILDIAGGRGEISFELMNLNGFKSTIIDPRNYIDYSRFKRKLLKGFYHRNDPLSSFNHKTEIPTEDEIKIPEHVKIFWGPSVWECLSLCTNSLCLLDDYDESYANFRSEFHSTEFFDSNNNLVEQFQYAKDFMWTDKGLKVNESNEIITEENLIPVSKNEPGNSNSWDFMKLKYLLENCSCVVGMHPDQAAEGIVDFAIKMKKPFALIPCCVYSKQFPRRFTSKGERVTNHRDLIDHLCSKHEGIKIELLPIEGKNTILYWNPNENL